MRSEQPGQSVVNGHNAASSIRCSRLPSSWGFATACQPQRQDPVSYTQMCIRDSDYSYDAVMAVQNTPDGYYVASTMPEAAYQAVSGSIPVEGVDAAALLTDGASRLVDAFRLMSWEELFCLLSKEGPASLIARTRKVETDGVTASDGRKRKHHDDATAVLVEFVP